MYLYIFFFFFMKVYKHVDLATENILYRHIEKIAKIKKVLKYLKVNLGLPTFLRQIPLSRVANWSNILGRKFFSSGQSLDYLKKTLYHYFSMRETFLGNWIIKKRVKRVNTFIQNKKPYEYLSHLKNCL